jgi:hypothetical protein
MLTITPTPTRHVISDEPPTLINGSATPVKGMTPVTTAKFMSD